MKIIAVIPAYNEEGSIFKVAQEAGKYSDEVIVVDDGSADDTARLALEAGATTVRHIINRGQGAALATGTKAALARGADVIVHFDADGQHDAAEIPEVAAPVIAGEADVALGSRFLGKRSNLPWAKERLLFPIARLVNRWLLGAVLTDPQSGFRALSRRAAGTIRIRQDGMAHCSEIIGQIFKHGLRAKEVPITVVYRRFGVNFSGGLSIIKDIMIAKMIN